MVRAPCPIRRRPVALQAGDANESWRAAALCSPYAGRGTAGDRSPTPAREQTTARSQRCSEADGNLWKWVERHGATFRTPPGKADTGGGPWRGGPRTDNASAAGQGQLMVDNLTDDLTLVLSSPGKSCPMSAALPFPRRHEERRHSTRPAGTVWTGEAVFRTRQVAGASPAVGSTRNPAMARKRRGRGCWCPRSLVASPKPSCTARWRRTPMGREPALPLSTTRPQLLTTRQDYTEEQAMVDTLMRAVCDKLAASRGPEGGATTPAA